MEEQFEIVFSFDTTGSMYSCLEKVRSELSDMVQELNRKIPNLRIAIFAHGDYCDSRTNYVTKYIDFTKDSSTLCNFVRSVSATYGGDTPECYELVMREVQEKLAWTQNSQKALVLIGDATPHDKDEKQNYRHLDWKEETSRLCNKGIKIYAVHCKSSFWSEYFYQHIAAKTFGYYLPLSDFDEVKKVLMNICFREAGLESSLVASTAFVSSRVRPSSPIEDEDYREDSDEENEDDDMRIDCSKCKKWKPPNEFPSIPISKKCEHNPGVCLRCIVKHVEGSKTCPDGNCDVKFEDEQSTLQLKICEATLNKMFQDYAKVYDENRKALLATKGRVITVTSVTGDTCWVDFDSSMTVMELRKKIEKELGIKEPKQKLLFKDTHIKKNKAPGHPFRLRDYGIDVNDTINLIIPLYCIPYNLDHVVFDLSWEFPAHHADFLDASCLAFDKNEFISVIDWNHSNNQYYLKGAIVHSVKNVKTPDGRIGRQEIHVYLKKLPTNVSHLYFTLSSWKATSLENFKNPRLQFYDASSPDTDLCGTTFTHALSCQAVIMCSVVRIAGNWQIFECDAGSCTTGNTKMYNPLCERISKLIADECE